jgi:CHAT domain-containing protein
MGRWDARTVARLPLGATRLVVLAGCQTLGTLPGALDGVAGLAGAFRAAGVHGVLGATWRVDDAATQPLMYAFHRAYAARGDGPEALRSAQLEMLQQPQAELRAASAWAAFGYVGQ